MSNISDTLFPRSLKEFLRDTGVGIKDLNRWHRKKWISFMPDSKKMYGDRDYDEVTFIKNLVKAGLPEKMVDFMISQLSKSSSFRNLFWDFNKNEWVNIDELAEKIVEEKLAEIIETNLESYLENLAENDREGIENIFTLIKKLRIKK